MSFEQRTRWAKIRPRSKYWSSVNQPSQRYLHLGIFVRINCTRTNLLQFFQFKRFYSLQGPLEVSDVNKHGCKLKWEKPEDDGGVPIEYYEIEKLDPLTGQWIPCGKSVEPEATITGLQEGKPYKFRVKAVNREGESDELETEKSIIAKNPFGTFRRI